MFLFDWWIYLSKTDFHGIWDYKFVNPSASTATAIATPGQLHEQIAEKHSQLSDICIYQLRYLHAYSLPYNNSKFMRMEKNSTATLSSMEHDHCMNCFSRYCDILPNNCPQIQCPNCSARLHNCKLDDHLEICTRVGILCHSFKSSGFLTNKQLWWEVAAFVIFTILPIISFLQPTVYTLERKQIGVRSVNMITTGKLQWVNCSLGVPSTFRRPINF